MGSVFAKSWVSYLAIPKDALDDEKDVLDLAPHARPSTLYVLIPIEAGRLAFPSIAVRSVDPVVDRPQVWVILRLVKGLLQPGWYLFIVEPVSKSTPVKYQDDGKGDAGHIGMYTDQTVGGTYVEVAHSSASRGRVTPSTLKNAWNYAGKPKDIAFDERSGTMTETAATPGYGTVIASPSLRMRKTPGTDGEYMQKVPEGARVQIVETRTVDGKVWGRTSYAKHEGWVQATDYVRMDQEDAEGEAPASTPATADDRTLVEVTRYKGGPLTSEQALNLVTELLGSNYTATLRRV